MDEDGNTGDEAILAEARDFLRASIAADGDNRTNGLDDLKFAAGDQWSPQDRRLRELSGRPCLTINKIPTFLHQVTNDQRQNKMAAKIHPVADADKRKAEVVQGVVRHIEYASNASVATGTAVGSAASIGFGYYRIVTQYCREDSFDQEFAFKRIRNPFTVYMDPGIQEVDGSDQKRCMLSERVPIKEFKRQYPKAKALGDQSLPMGAGDNWISDWKGQDWVRVAEFYKIEETSAVLVMTDQGPKWESDLKKLSEGPQTAPPPQIVLKDGKPMRRTSAKRKVMWRKITGAEVLETAEIPGRWIPVFPIVGDEVDIDGKVIRSGLIRHAKDPARMYNYWLTAATEEIALRPKSKYVGAEGQFEDHEEEWAAANVSASPYIEYKPVTLDGTLAPAPARQPLAEVPAGMILMARTASDDIKATTGLFDSSLGAKGTATSGIQERAQQIQGDTANFHYMDNARTTYRHAVRYLVDAFPQIYDGARIVQIMGEDEKIKPQAINGLNGDPNAIDVTTGEYDITIGTGPDYSTARQEATDALIEVNKAWPKLMDIAGDKVIANMDFFGSEEVAERVKRSIPPQILGPQEQDGEDQPMVQTPHGPVTIEQAAQMIGQLSQDAEMLTAELEKASKGIPQAQINAQAKLQQAQMDNATRIQEAEIRAVSASDVAELNGLISLLLQKMQPPPELEADAMQTGKAKEH